MADKFISDLDLKTSDDLISSDCFVFQPNGGQENTTYRIQISDIVDWIQLNTNYTEVYSLPVSENLSTGDSQITVISDTSSPIGREPIITCKEQYRLIGFNTEDPVASLDLVTYDTDNTIGDLMMSDGDGNRMGFDVSTSSGSPQNTTISIGRYLQSTLDLVFIPLFTIDQENNTSIGENNPDAVCEVTSFTKLGAGAPEIKQKKLTGTTNAAEGGTTTIAHGLAKDKIISCTVLVKNSSSDEWIPPNDSSVADCFYSFKIGDTYITITNKAAASSDILSQDIACLVTYEK